MMILRLLSVAGTAMCVLYVLVYHFNLWTLILSMGSVIYVVYQADKTPEDRLIARNRAVLITGCDSGFGKDLARHLDEIGVTVFAGCLDAQSTTVGEMTKEASERLHVIQLDVTNDQQVAAASTYVKTVLDEQNIALWGVVNNAGINFLGDAELTTMEQYLRVSDVNLFGVVRVTNAFLPLVRKCKGRIVNVSSVKGRVALPCNAAYCISKYGVETFSDILRMEMRHFGVRVIVVEPGNFSAVTAILQKPRITADFQQMWDGMGDGRRETYGRDYVFYMPDKEMESAESNGRADISLVTNAMDAALFKVNPKTRYLIGGSSGYYDIYKWLAIVNPYLPTRVCDWVLCRFYKGFPVPAAVSSKNR